MTYFIEHDEAGNIVHACADPLITIVPLVNRVTFRDAKGIDLKDADGKDLSPFGSKLLDPVGVDQTTYNSLISDGLDTYTFDVTSRSVTKKAAANG